MKKLVIGLCALAVCGQFSLIAASITPDFPAPNGSGGFTYPIAVSLGAGESVQSGDAFAVFDAGKVFNIVAPANWTVSTPLQATIPGALVVNDPAVADLLFTYSGPTIDLSATFDFSFDGLTNKYHVTMAAVRTSIPAGGMTTVGYVIAPNAVPEPASMALLGAGLAAVAVLRRRVSSC